MSDKVDDLYVKLGGFSRYQVFILMVYLCSSKSIGLIIVNMSYLEKVPDEYFCTYEKDPSSWKSCKPEDFCKDPTVLQYEPNLDLEGSYDNWVNKLDLACASPNKIGFILSAYFLGWIVTLTFLPRMSDMIGR